MSRVHSLIIAAIVGFAVVAGGIALSRTLAPEPAAATSIPFTATDSDRSSRLAAAEEALARLQAQRAAAPTRVAPQPQTSSDDDAWERDDDHGRDDDWEGEDDD